MALGTEKSASVQLESERTKGKERAAGKTVTKLRQKAVDEQKKPPQSSSCGSGPGCHDNRAGVQVEPGARRRPPAGPGAD